MKPAAKCGDSDSECHHCISDMRINSEKGGQPEFLVKKKSMENKIWETLENLGKCETCVIDYFQSHPEKFDLFAKFYKDHQITKEFINIIPYLEAPN